MTDNVIPIGRDATNAERQHRYRERRRKVERNGKRNGDRNGSNVQYIEIAEEAIQADRNGVNLGRSMAVRDAARRAASLVHLRDPVEGYLASLLNPDEPKAEDLALAPVADLLWVHWS
jgi:hypothetical protein